VESFQYFEGMDIVFGFSEDTVEVYSLEPFQYLETIEGLTRFREQKGMNYLFGAHKKQAPIHVYSRDPFCYLWTIDEGDESEAGDDPTVDAFRLTDGREFAAYREFLYGLHSQEIIPMFGPGGLIPDETGSKYVEKFSSEGWACIVVRNENVIIDLSDRSIKGRIPCSASGSPGFYGQQDEETGRNSAEYFGSGGIVYRYRAEKTELPADIDGQIALARELLGSRELTDPERREWHLN
jgi:hypothetical protein